MPMLAPGSKQYLIRFFLVTAASVVACLLGFLLLPQGASATLVWPPSALGIAVLFLYGLDLWPALVVSIIVVFYFRNGNLPFDIVIALADTLEALIGAYFLRTYVEFSPMLARLRDTIGLMVACIAPTMLSAILISFSSYFFGRIEISSIQGNFASIWTGHAVSALCFTPFLLRWLYRPKFRKSKSELIEGVFIFGSITTLCYLLFWTSYSSIGSVSLLYVLLLPLMWAALRSGPRGTTLGLVLLAVISTTGVLYGHSQLTTSHNPLATFLLQVLLGALNLIFLLVTSIVEERKEAVVQLQKNVEQLEVAIQKVRSEDQAKTNFLAILAHELRNPLAPIVTSVELMKSEPGSHVVADYIKTIESHAHTISLLLEDLLDISRISQNKFELRRERVALRVVLDRSIESVQPFLTSRQHALHITLPPGDIFLDVDPTRMEQMLVNLLNNSGKYTDPGGRIAIVVTREGRFAKITVSDNGIGIAPDKLPGVFEPFGQRGAVVRLPGGLGVGLSLTKQLVELHGGEIEAYSRGLGKGSTFTLCLPLSSSDGTIIAGQKSFVSRFRNSVGTLTKRTILVVDDNEAAAKGLGELLRRSGHTVFLAYSGQEALGTISIHAPEVVILDIGLPDMTGFEVAQKIRRLHIEVRPNRLIALTGYGQEDDKAKSREAGFDAHLTKPVTLADVEAAL